MASIRGLARSWKNSPKTCGSLETCDIKQNETTNQEIILAVMQISLSCSLTSVWASVWIGMLVLSGCAHQFRSSDMPASGIASELQGATAGENEMLAGEWDYEESGMTITLKLDRFGNGTYDFKDGRFMTSILVDRVWKGRWLQRENDREGGFEIALSADYKEGEGRWWYTRIEGDRSPKKPGGTFRVTKNSVPLDARSISVLYSATRSAHIHRGGSIASYRQE
jgi:hypothetical protein